MTRLIYGKTSSGRKKTPQTKALAKAKAEHEKFLKSYGFTPAGKRGPKLAGVAFPDLSADKPGVVPVSNAIPGGVVPRVDIINDHRWKADRQETEATKNAIAEKAMAVGPQFHKGGYGYAPYNKPTDTKKQ